MLRARLIESSTFPQWTALCNPKHILEFWVSKHRPDFNSRGLLLSTYSLYHFTEASTFPVFTYRKLLADWLTGWQTALNLASGHQHVWMELQYTSNPLHILMPYGKVISVPIACLLLSTDPFLKSFTFNFKLTSQRDTKSNCYKCSSYLPAVVAQSITRSITEKNILTTWLQLEPIVMLGDNLLLIY